MKPPSLIEVLEAAARKHVRDEMSAGDAVLVFGLRVSQIRLLRDFYEARAGKAAGTIALEEVPVPAADVKNEEGKIG